MMKKTKSFTLLSCQRLVKLMRHSRILAIRVDSCQLSPPQASETNHARNVLCVSTNQADVSVAKIVIFLYVQIDLVSAMNILRDLGMEFVICASEADGQQIAQRTLNT